MSENSQHVKLTALVNKGTATKLLDLILEKELALYAYYENSRSSGFFDFNQFGEYSEANILGLILYEKHIDEVVKILHDYLDLETKNNGIIFVSNPLVRLSV